MIIQMYSLGENKTLHETLNGVFKEEGDIEELLAFIHDNSYFRVKNVAKCY